MSFIIAKRAKSQVQGARRPLQASNLPYEHADLIAAQTEARRLAGENPGFEFYILQPVRQVVASVTLEENVLE